MALNSMTGFARTQGQDDGRSWIWEVRSVNAKGLDVRLRLPSGLEGLEKPVRDAIAKRFKRGSITANLNMNESADKAAFQINEDLLEHLVHVAAGLESRFPGLDAPRIDGLMAIKGVLETTEEAEDEETVKAREAAVFASLEAALDAMAAARAEEGARLTEVLSAQVTTIETLTKQAQGLAAVQPEAIRARITAQVTDLLGDAASGLEDRLAQEIAILVTKADVREELDRLTAHVGAARDLMASKDAVGRRLDFLCQEFNREANTLCSKSSDTALTTLGLELKTVVDQLREQVQNIE